MVNVVVYTFFRKFRLTTPNALVTVSLANLPAQGVPLSVRPVVVSDDLSYALLASAPGPKPAVVP